jgi:GNAT superfamily N-acetyltransferase
MGRVIGDGGWYFHIIDMAVLPAHQRRGLGEHVLAYLLSVIRQAAPVGAYVSLMADAPGRKLYAPRIPANRSPLDGDGVANGRFQHGRT